MSPEEARLWVENLIANKVTTMEEALKFADQDIDFHGKAAKHHSNLVGMALERRLAIMEYREQHKPTTPPQENHGCCGRRWARGFQETCSDCPDK